MANTSAFRGRDMASLNVIDVTGTTGRTLSVVEALAGKLKFIGTLSQSVTLRLPLSADGLGDDWVFWNATSGGYTLTLAPSSGTGVDVTPGSVVSAFFDGAAMVATSSGSGGMLGGSPVTVTSPTAGDTIIWDDDADQWVNAPILVQITEGNTREVLDFTHQYVNADFPLASADHPDYSVLELRHTNLASTANISALTDLIWTGLRSSVTYGSASVDARGTEHAMTFTVDCQGSAGALNELAGLMGWMRAKPASGTAADGVASMWFTDFSLHGNIGAQSALLNGVTMLVNSYHTDSPSRGPSAAAWFVTKQAQGAGREDGHHTAQTYPLDYMVGIAGYSGTADEVTKTRAAQIGLAVGEWGSGWMISVDDDESWFQYAASLRGGEAAALRISDPHANAVGSYVGSGILFETRITGRQWNWWLDAGSAEAPTVGAIRLHGTNGATAGRVQWGATNAPALYRSANNVLRWEGAAILAPAAIAAGTTSTAHMYVRNDSNAELAVFEGAGALSSVFLRLGPGSAAAQRLYPQAAATAGNTTREMGGTIYRASYWTGAASADIDAQVYHKMVAATPESYLVLLNAGHEAVFVRQDGTVIISPDTTLPSGPTEDFLVNVTSRFLADISLENGTDFVAGTGAGSSLGTAANQVVGMHGAKVAQNTGWGSITNVTPDKAYDANATTLDELADVTGTLIAALVAKGILGD